MKMLKIFCCIIFTSFFVFTQSDGTHSLTISPNEASLEEKNDEFELDNDSKNVEIFLAEEHWKDIKDGQAIPAGLHIRMNLETGKKEAKLMSKSATEKDDSLNLETLKNTLKNIKADDLTVDIDKSDLKKKFKSIEKLKQELSEIEMNMETDTEIMIKLLDKLNTTETNDLEKISILNELEYHLHQIDNALNLIQLNGLDLVLSFLNSSNPELRSASAFVIGSAMQSNNKFKIELMNKNILIKLIRLISLDASVKVKTKAIYALSCLIRQFPYAQLEILKIGGPSILSNFLNEENDVHLFKIKKKVISLFNDLIQEKEAVLGSQDNKKDHIERIEQYRKINIKESAPNLGFCEAIPKLFISDDHSTRELAVDAMINFLDVCSSKFHPFLYKIKELKLIYEKLSQEEINGNDLQDNYFTILYGNIIKLEKMLTSTRKEEL